jgi:hypothetical protein
VNIIVFQELINNPPTAYSAIRSHFGTVVHMFMEGVTDPILITIGVRTPNPIQDRNDAPRTVRQTIDRTPRTGRQTTNRTAHVTPRILGPTRVDPAVLEHHSPRMDAHPADLEYDFDTFDLPLEGTSPIRVVPDEPRHRRNRRVLRRDRGAICRCRRRHR